MLRVFEAWWGKLKGDWEWSSDKGRVGVVGAAVFKVLRSNPEMSRLQRILVVCAREKV